VNVSTAPGGRDLSVTNPDGQSATLSGAFTVMSASALMLIEITQWTSTWQEMVEFGCQQRQQ
jgi:hypothetical protein